MRVFASLAGVAAIVLWFASPPASTSASGVHARPGPMDVLYAAPGDLNYSYGPKGAELNRLRASLTAAATSTFVVTYDAAFNANAPAKAAFQAAIDIWSNIITSPVPIRVNAQFAALSTGVLGSAGPAGLCANFVGGVASTWYAAALADKLNGSAFCATANGTDREINASFNGSFTDWEYGTTGTGVAGKYNFMTVVMHEVGHGLGFYGSMTSTAGIGSFGYGTTQADVYDRFAVTGAGLALLSFTNSSASLHAQLISNDTFFNGTATKANNSGQSAKLETHDFRVTFPGRGDDNGFLRGSSYSHIDDVLYSGTPNGMQTWQLSGNEVYTDPGPIMRGIFTDEGWTIAGIACTYALTPTSASLGSSASAGNTVTVTTQTGCAWTAVSNAAAFVTVTGGASGTGSGTVTYSMGANGAANSRIGTITIAGQTFTITQAGLAPVFTTHPSSQAYSAGQTVQFTGAATGTPTPTYQWQISIGGSVFADLLNVAPYSGAATATLTVTAASAALNGNQYRVVATNTSGSANSNAASLVLNVAPSFTTHPASVSTVAGQNAQFVVVAIGPPTPTIQWQASSDGGTTYANLTNVAPYSGVTTTTLTITAAPIGLSGNRYRAVATNLVGPVNSNAAVLTVTAPPTVALDKTSLQFAATNSGAAFTTQTVGQAVRLSQSGTGTVTWTATASQPWVTVTPSSGTGSATMTIAVVFASSLPVSGTSTAAVTFTFTGASNTAGPITVGLTTKPNGTSTVAFGTIDTPAEGVTGVTGSIPVTGWALDDIEVRQVRILRDAVAGEGAGPIFLGTAVLVDGARPDVSGLNPTLPRNTRAGWGYLLLTNFLPNQGNGTFRLLAMADDVEGNAVLLGTRTITCSNSTATRPFGAIDTPGQGETISGPSYNNFGWVLARGPALAYPPNGTVSVVIDGVFGAAPTGWSSRSDLTALFSAATFPGVTNALGVSTFSTTTLANGVHTIAWVVTADNLQADGIGSRYFTVANGSSVSAAEGSVRLQPDPSTGGSVRLQPDQHHSLTIESPVFDAGRVDDVGAAAIDRTQVIGRRGYDLTAPWRAYAVDASGRTTIHGEELDRFEVRLGSEGAGPGGRLRAQDSGLRAQDSDRAAVVTGYMRAGDTLGPLPIGSRLDPATGLFTWQPGVGFVHAYDLVFVRRVADRVVSRQEVRFVLHPQGSNRVGPQVMIDTPAPAGTTVGSFLLAGWAVDLDADADSGVDTVHVWAYPVKGAAHDDPIFVGAAAYGGERPDVGALFGERFTRSGYGLMVDNLPPGTYDLAVFAWSTVQNGFVPAKVVRVSRLP